MSTPLARTRVRLLVGLAAPLVLLALASARGAAQASAAPGAVEVTVHDSSGAAIVGAQIAVDSSSVNGITDDDGKVRLSPIRPGPAWVTVRRLGFHPGAIQVRVLPDSTVPATVTLAQAIQPLPPVLVRASTHQYDGRMGGFYERRSQGIGRFITGDEIERQHPLELTDIFRTIPGARLTSTTTIPNAVRFRGSTTCAPLVWIDGMPAAAAEFDLDDLSPESIAGIEIYSGISEVPIQFQDPDPTVHNECGVLVIWTRHGERGEKKIQHPVTAAELAKLVESLKVYTANEVDVPAHPDTSVRVEPAYPDSLYTAGVSGAVMAEFVVDTTGHILMNTFGVISSSDPLFTRSVRRALLDVTYVPAMLHGHTVKQVVQQPFRFTVDTTVLRHRPRP